MFFGALGDIHGDADSVRRIMRRHADVPYWICVGDVADAAGRYEPFDAPLYWIKGNNENFDAIASGDLPAGHHYIPNGVLTGIGPPALRVAGLGGTLAPTWYDTPGSELPHPKSARGPSDPSTLLRVVLSLPKDEAPEGSRPEAGRRASARGGGAPRAVKSARGPSEAPEGSRPEAGRRASARGGGAPRAVKDDKRRHFVREEVEACKAMRNVDVFLSHEAPRPYVVGHGPGRANDAGKTPINEILAAMTPRLHLFGHHHRFTESERQGVRSVGLDLVSKSYLLIDAGTLEYHLGS